MSVSSFAGSVTGLLVAATLQGLPAAIVNTPYTATLTGTGLAHLETGKILKVAD